MAFEDSGFVLLEALLALILTAVVTAAALALVNPSQSVSQAQPAAADMQQRIRVAADALTKDLLAAGAGIDGGAGPLVAAFAPVIPRKMGLNGDSPALARPDAITTAHLPGPFLQTTTTEVLPGTDLRVSEEPNCPWGQILCGFRPGMAVVVFDNTAHHDVFTVESIQGDRAQLQSHARAVAHTYPAGSRVAEVAAISYYLDAASHQLRQYDGYQSDVPIADDVVGLSFEYFGDSNPPIAPKPPPGVENCLYDPAGALKPMAVLGGADEVVPLPLGLLSDGPWCGSGDTQFDADLLRVRAIRVSIRVQATLPAFRAAGPAFVVPGTSRASSRYLPDVVATFRVAPRNLNLSR